MTTITLNHFNNFKYTYQQLQQIGILLILCVVFMTPISAQTFTQQTGSNNLFDGVDVGTHSAPAFVDIDNDGDFDCFIGENNGNINYYENTGTNIAATFVKKTGSNNPLDLVNIVALSNPTFVDIDNDGDFDAFIGLYDGTTNCYLNIGTSTTPDFVKLSASNPLIGVDVGLNSCPTFADMDNDGDFDAFIGGHTGNIRYYKNTGTSTTPTFVKQTGSNNPLNGVDVGDQATPTVVDMDNDGDFDVIIGEYLGIMNYYKNTGTNTNPTLVKQTGSNNPLNGKDVGTRSTPVFVDIDNDGDVDFFSGEEVGNINYYLNTTPLPVELTYFRGEATVEGNSLTWQTASEENNEGFEIQRSVDSDEWETIDFVEGNGTTLEVQNYSFSDVQPFSERNYYRLKQIDFDGQFEYSDIVNITREEFRNTRIALFPNPVQDELNIVDGQGQATIYNRLGQQVRQFLISNAQFKMNTTDLPKGLYFLQIQQEDGQIKTKQFIK